MGSVVQQDLVGCARCEGDGHRNIVFAELTHPVRIPVGDEEVVYTHWAPCPTNGEPILFRYGPKP